jgi:hypothetical protein
MTTRKYSSRSQQTTLTSAVTSGALTIPVLSASTLFGGVTVNAGETFTVVIDPDTALEEIVDVTAASSNNLTVTRAVDMAGATAQDHSAGAVVRHMIIGRDLRESNLHIEATTGYNDGTGAHALHGLSNTDGNVVGTAAAQTLTNKTLTTPVVNGATLSGTITSTATVSGGTITGAVVTGLSAPSNGSDATTKTYVDAILGSATAAATSAASAAASATAAATSATSAAASATSAATSATSALTSQTAAATSATSAANSSTAAATSATSAAASATAAATSATSAAVSATAANSSAITAAASVATIATYASNAATSATSAANSATAAATSAASAAASTSAAATSAASAATSATAAATSASSASASQTAAATSATSAAASQTAAATSASSAATSATAAATSASSAATSASDAAATYDNFDDRYLGAKSTAPTVDNDGNALLTGALYFNSVLAAMYVWTGTAWSVMATSGDIESVTAGTGLTGGGASGAVTVALDTTSIYVVPTQSGQTGKFLTTNGSAASWASVDALPSQTGNGGKYLGTNGSTASWSVVAGSLAQPTEPSSPADGQIWIDTDGTAPTTVVTRWTKQPSGGTTVLSGNDDYSIPLAYSPGYEQVFINGVLLSRSGTDYTATSGTSITLAAATVAGDIVEVICPLQIATTDTYTQSAANAAFVPKTLTSTTGDIIYASGANTPARLGIGSTGQLLTVSGGVPTWSAPPASGSMTLISTTTLSTGTTTISSIPSTYKDLKLIITGMSNQTTERFRMRFNGSTTGYFELPYGESSSQTFTSTSLLISGGNSNITGAVNSWAQIDIWDYASTGHYQMSTNLGVINTTNTTTAITNFTTGVSNVTGAISSITVFINSGSMTGTAYLYGVN